MANGISCGAGVGVLLLLLFLRLRPPLRFLRSTRSGMGLLGKRDTGANSTTALVALCLGLDEGVDVVNGLPCNSSQNRLTATAVSKIMYARLKSTVPCFLEM